ncbi:MAG: hypothetical protein ACXIUL_00465 [Wenzhouxiangella sp.]
MIKALPGGVRAWYRLPLAGPCLGLVAGAGLAVLALGLVHGVLPWPLNGFVLMVAMVSLWIVVFRQATGLLIDQAELDSDLDLLIWPGTRQAFVAFLLLALLAALFQLLPWWLAVPFLPLWAWAMPLAALSLARGEGLLDALYPPLWKALSDDLGRPIRRWMAIALLIASVVYLAAAGLLSALPVTLRSMVLMALWVYLLLAWYALLGQLWRLRFAPDPAATVDDSPASPCSLDQQWQALQRDGGTLADFRRLADALELADDRAREQVHARRFITALLEGFERPQEAVERVDRLLLRFPEFCLEKPSEQWALIQAARHHGHPDLVDRLCANFLAGFPAAPLRAQVAEVHRLNQRIKEKAGNRGIL